MFCFSVIQGTREHLLALSINGILLAIFGGQPLVIFGLTMPLIIFDQVINEICTNYALDFLPFRMWIGMWTAVFLLLFLAFGISVYIRYLTRFTLEVFLLLIGFCVLYSASHMLQNIKKTNPITSPYFQEHSCFCIRYVETTVNSTLRHIGGGSRLLGESATLVQKTVEYLNVSFGECEMQKGTLSGGGCHTGVYFLTLLITLCTFLVVSLLAYLRLSGFLPRSVRKHILLQAFLGEALLS